jgi:hypothetical protein
MAEQRLGHTVPDLDIFLIELGGGPFDAEFLLPPQRDIQERGPWLNHQAPEEIPVEAIRIIEIHQSPDAGDGSAGVGGFPHRGSRPGQDKLDLPTVGTPAIVGNQDGHGTVIGHLLDQGPRDAAARTIPVN